MSDKRTQLKQAATEAVQRSGLQNLSFRTLADQVGVKSSSVHYYFPEKSDLAANLIESYTESFVEILGDIDKKHQSLSDKIDAFVKIFEDVVKAKKFCLCGMMAAEVATLNDANRKLISNYFKILENWLAVQFENNKNQIDSNYTPETLAQIVLSGLEGAILLDRVDDDQDRLKAQHKLIKVLINNT